MADFIGWWLARLDVALVVVALVVVALAAVVAVLRAARRGRP